MKGVNWEELAKPCGKRRLNEGREGVSITKEEMKAKGPRRRALVSSPLESEGTPDVVYREIRPSETDAVSSLARGVFDEFVAPHYQTEGVSEFHRYASAEALSQRHQSGYITLVADDSGELAGMLHLRKPSHVSMLFVRSSRQRRGIARGLLAAAEALAGEADCPFTVSSSPNAVAAYERLGFRITGSEQCVNGIRFTPMQRLPPNDCNT
jgi:GNAT superfamily N-acetyltransferase